MKVEIGPYSETPDNEERVVNIQIDKYDTWNMDSTLALIILPMLKQLRETKHGSAIVDLEDIPEEMRVVGYNDLDQTQSYLDFENKEEYEELSWKQYEVRWNWVMDEMIWAFEQMVEDGNDDIYFKNGILNVEGWKAHNKRIDNGTRLFGVYFRGLWD